MLESLIPTPLHPAIVHLPIALTLLVLPFALGALWAIRRGARPVRSWGIATALIAALTLSAWASIETGEQADERVESVVAEAPIKAHESAADVFLLLSVATLAVAALGLRSGRIGSSARALGTVGACALIFAGWRVGHSGGALVYKYGAASAYIGDTSRAAIAQLGADQKQHRLLKSERTEDGR